jgi:hypothetical protein
MSWVAGFVFLWAANPTCGAAETEKPVVERADGRGAGATNWWSLRPLSKPTVPIVGKGSWADSNPIDAFVLARLMEKGLSPSPEADRRTLIRRLYFDLVGLPPTPQEVDAFVSDASPGAYGGLVERLLASPRYGERWARHWLDVVHYGETHGYDKDQPRPNAWPYRDYVIRSFNGDKPYGRFVEEQVAGDVLFPQTRDGFEALGFLSAGPWDLIGHAEVPETKTDGKVARHLDRDDMVVNTIQTFTSLTVQCAQCHNHKFDPISQEEYYSLQAVFAAIDRTDKKYDTDPVVARRRAELETSQRTLESRRAELDKSIRSRAGEPLAEVEKRIAELKRAAASNEAFGYHSAIATKPDELKWVQVDLGRTVAVHRVTLHACRDDFNGIGEGFGFPVRYKVEVSDDPMFGTGVTVIGDRTGTEQVNPRLKAVEIGGDAVMARHVRVTATRLSVRQDDYIFALAELGVFDAGGVNVAEGAAVTSLDSIEAPVRWRQTNLTDGWHPGMNVAGARGVQELEGKRAELLALATGPGEAEALALMEGEMAVVKVGLGKLPSPSTVYVASVHQGNGAFAGTGAKGGKPRTVHVLSRGNILKPGKEAEAGALGCVAELPSRFGLGAQHGEGERRAALARWLSSRDNVLTWRSIVNRVWQQHFGRGLVETPNDFGRMGAEPSHPELLDWLAVAFRDGGQSFKGLHRQIVTSATYRQASVVAGREEAVGIDSDNQYLWRANRRKLEAEAVRDAVLMIAGHLDLTMGGPSFRDFVIERPEHSPHYQYHLHDPDDARSHRRSIYRFIVRSQQEPFMTVLDCADPSMQVARRNESVSPLQALSMLNHPLMLTMARRFAERLEQGSGDLAGKVEVGWCEVTGRLPTAEETRAVVGVARAHGLANACRVLFNLNEFLFVD